MALTSALPRDPEPSSGWPGDSQAEAEVRERIVVVDDDSTMANLLSDVLIDEGHDAVTFTDPRAALASILESPPSLVITDMRMGTFDGMTLVEQVATTHPGLPVILVTAYGSVDTAIEATRRGAYHFITKPFRLKEVLLVVERALGHRRMQRENERLRRAIDSRYRFGGLIGKSAAMHRVFDLIERVAKANSNVLVLGESGTGKELVARAIHQESPRRAAPFVAVNCSALPEGLLESELFGHVRGSFTGAHQNKVGLFQEASNGTLFLDEIGDMPVPLQAKVLRAIQEKMVRPVGSNREVRVETRIIAATHQDLRELVRQGRFREDLYYRLSVIPVELPPLRQRAEDVPLLVSHFIDQIARGLGVAPKPVEHSAMMHLMRMRWEGNVRELQNVIERAHVLSRGQSIRVEDLPPGEPHGDPHGDSQSSSHHVPHVSQHGSSHPASQGGRAPSSAYEPDPGAPSGHASSFSTTNGLAHIATVDKPPSSSSTGESNGSHVIRPPVFAETVTYHPPNPGSPTTYPISAAPGAVASGHPAPDTTRPDGAVEAAISHDGRWPSLEEVALRYIVSVLRHTGGNKDKAAQILGIDRRTLYRWRSRNDLDAMVTAPPGAPLPAPGLGPAARR